MKNYRIRMKLMLAVVLFAIIPAIIMSIIYYNVIRDTEIERIATYMLNNIHNINDSIDINLSQIEHASPGIISDAELISSMRMLSRKKGNYRLKEASRYLDGFLSEKSMGNSYLDNVYIYSDVARLVYAAVGKRTVFFLEEYEQNEWYCAIPRDNKRASKWVLAKDIGEEKNILAIYKPIREFEKNAYIGTVGFTVDERDLRKEIDLRNDYEADIYIEDEAGRYISHAEAARVGEPVPRGDDFVHEKNEGYLIRKTDRGDVLTVYYLSEYAGWRYVSVVPVREILSTIDIFRNYAFTIILLMIALMVGWNAYIARVLYKPIMNLTIYMKKLQKGNFGFRIKEKRQDEIGYIYDRYNYMADNIQRLINDLYIQKILRQQAQLNAIETEINEHFLYNTLDSIRWMIRIGNNKEASDLIYKLSQLFRQSLNSGSEIATVGQIVELLENYIDIIKLRYREHFDCEFDVDGKVLDANVLKYIFQPIVENAVFHGMDNSAEKLLVKIAFKRKGDLLEFSVWDNGSGISTERMKEIAAALQADVGELDSKDCFALKNINLQIRLFYGEQYGLVVKSEEYRWTKVSFEIPLITGQKEAVEEKRI